jgi:hypothetical protein
MQSSHGLDRLKTGFDDERLVDHAGLLLPATLAAHLGLRKLVDEHLDLGSAPGRAHAGDKFFAHHPTWRTPCARRVTPRILVGGRLMDYWGPTGDVSEPRCESARRQARREANSTGSRIRASQLRKPVQLRDGRRARK